jgi:hypothetical protein
MITKQAFNLKGALPYFTGGVMIGGGGMALYKLLKEYNRMAREASGAKKNFRDQGTLNVHAYDEGSTKSAFMDIDWKDMADKVKGTAKNMFDDATGGNNVISDQGPTDVFAKNMAILTGLGTGAFGVHHLYDAYRKNVLDEELRRAKDVYVGQLKEKRRRSRNKYASVEKSARGYAEDDHSYSEFPMLESSINAVRGMDDPSELLARLETISTQAGKSGDTFSLEMGDGSEVPLADYIARLKGDPTTPIPEMWTWRYGPGSRAYYDGWWEASDAEEEYEAEAPEIVKLVDDFANWGFWHGHSKKADGPIDGLLGNAATLLALLAIGSGVGTYKLLSKNDDRSDMPESDMKSIRGEARKQLSRVVLDKDPKSTKDDKTLYQTENDIGVDADALEHMIRSACVLRPGGLTDDLVCALGAGRMEEVKSAARDFGGATVFDIVKGASDSSMDPVLKESGVGLLANDSFLKFAFSQTVASEIYDSAPHWVHLCAAVPDEQVEVLHKIASTWSRMTRASTYADTEFRKEAGAALPILELMKMVNSKNDSGKDQQDSDWEGSTFVPGGTDSSDHEEKDTDKKDGEGQIPKAKSDLFQANTDELDSIFS